MQSGAPAPLGRDPEQPRSRAAFEETKDRFQKRARDLGQRTSEAARARGDSYLAQASSKVRNIQKAASDAADDMSRSQPEPICRSVHEVSGRLGDLADYLERSDSQVIIDDTRDVIRKHPAAVLGGLVTAGFMVGRFLKASEPRNSNGEGGTA